VKRQVGWEIQPGDCGVEEVRPEDGQKNDGKLTYSRVNRDETRGLVGVWPWGRGEGVS